MCALYVTSKPHLLPSARRGISAESSSESGACAEFLLTSTVITSFIENDHNLNANVITRYNYLALGTLTLIVTEEKYIYIYIASELEIAWVGHSAKR